MAGKHILARKLWRDLMGAKGQFISLLIVVSLGVALYTGIGATFINLNNAAESYYDRYEMADYWVSLSKVPTSVLMQIERLSEVNQAQGRITAEFSAVEKGENITLRMHSLPPKSQENGIIELWLKSGHWPEDGKAQCLIEEGFYLAHGYKPGDAISVYYQGKNLKLTITGSVRSPEYVYALKDSGELMSDPIHFGIVYLPETYAQALTGNAQSYNEVLMKLSSGANLDTLKIEIEDMLDDYGLFAQYARKDQLSNAMLNEELKGLKSVSGSFPMVFMMASALIIFIMMGRVVEHQRSLIGVLKAFGFSDRQILMHYLSYGVLISLLGTLVGAGAGLYLGSMMTELENSYFHLPLETVKLYPELIVPSALLTTAFCLAASYRAAKKAAVLRPSEAMRPKAPSDGKRIVLERFKGFWKPLGFQWRIILRNLFRHKRRNVMSAVGVMFGTALLVVTFGMLDTVNALMVSQYETIQNYDIKITMNRLIPEPDWKELTKLEHVTRTEPLLEFGADLITGKDRKITAVIGLEEGAELYRVTDKSGKIIALSQYGMMMPEKLATKLGVMPGDRIDVKPLAGERKIKQATYSKSIFQFIGMSAYTRIEEASGILGEKAVANAFVMKIDHQENVEKVRAKLSKYPSIASISTKIDSYNNLQKNMELMTVSLSVMISLAAVLSIAIIYNVAAVSIHERERELASMKVLGLTDKELSQIIFVENYILAFMAVVIGLPAGYYLGQVMSIAYDTDYYSFQFYIGTKSYLYAAVCSMAFAWIANQWLKKKIRLLDMIGVLKSSD